MKTDDEQLRKRGFLPENAENQHLDINSRQLLTLLTSAKPTDRTLAARLIAIRQDDAFIEPLITALTAERKLYSKLDICNALVVFGVKAVEPLIDQLGEIGSNQHKSVADKPLNKDNYPLPRDIAARTLIRIGVAAMPKLFDALENGGTKQLNEAIDAIGFINYYEMVPECFGRLLACYNDHKSNEVTRWKCIRAMSGCREADVFLLELQKVETHPNIKVEIDRSLRLGGKKHAF